MSDEGNGQWHFDGVFVGCRYNRDLVYLLEAGKPSPAYCTIGKWWQLPTLIIAKYGCGGVYASATSRPQHLQRKRRHVGGGRGYPRHGHGSDEIASKGARVHINGESIG